MDSSARTKKPHLGERVYIESQHVTSILPQSETIQQAGVPDYLNLSAVMAANDYLAIFCRFGG